MRPPREDTEPWYKQFWPWFLISLPLSVVIASIVTINLAIQTNDGLVSDDYYKEGLAINQSLQRDRTAAELGVSAQLTIEESGDMVRLTLNKGSLAAYPEQLTLHLQHATHAGHDQILTLVRAPGDQYLGYLEQPIREGVWHISLATEEWRLGTRIHWESGLTISLEPQV